ncbi:E3 ubiquitin-protein ligase RNF170-like [Strongylocentrotus purpuratus]|uniref:E3 ubiquitin-protein ligase RNF170 n=1 Tax=Strongylocentrotus purpuratus TaxID=7668 RepID=A0A7M7T3Z8_STRPU|nr:E3 ubiquitin-protein ligase RNF170-like [Strongylocentrotus purpuratus]
MTLEMSQPERGTIVEGIGDEFFQILGLIIVVAVPFLVAYRNRLRSIATGAIHPESEAHVQHTRTQLRYGRPNADDHAASANGQATGESNGQQNGEGQSSDGRHGMSAQPYNGDRPCPICLDEKECAAETNCGHVFCGNCLIAYWRHGTWLGAISCPVCRQMVTIILPVFQEDEQNSGDGGRIMAEIRDYNRRFSGEPRPFMDYIYDLPTLLRHTARDFFSLHGIVWMFRLRIVFCFAAALLYLISPLDIIPEAVFGFFGFFDDIFVVLILAIYVTGIYRGIVAQRME